MELYFHTKLKIGVFLITAIIIAGILIWAKTFVFDAVPERDFLLLVVDILDIVSLNHRAIHMTIMATSTWFCVILSTYSVRMSDQAYKKH